MAEFTIEAVVDELMQLGEQKFFNTILLLNAITKKTKEINKGNADLRAKLEQENKRVKELEDTISKRFTAPIVCMCGSTKFKEVWISENARLTLEGNIVLSVGMFGHADGTMQNIQQNGSKIKLDDLHKRKIDLCDWVWVLDVDDYIGESTRSEIEYAKEKGKLIRFLSLESGASK
jgi:hypothetical protein